MPTCLGRQGNEGLAGTHNDATVVGGEVVACVRPKDVQLPSCISRHSVMAMFASAKLRNPLGAVHGGPCEGGLCPSQACTIPSAVQCITEKYYKEFTNTKGTRPTCGLYQHLSPLFSWLAMLSGAACSLDEAAVDGTE